MTENPKVPLWQNRLFLMAVTATCLALIVLFVSRLGPDTGRESWPEQFSSNGEMLYFTGRSASGATMVSQGGNPHRMMMGAGGCVDCHGTDRNGGRLWPTFWQTAPAITASALTGDHGEDGYGQYGHWHEAYGPETLARAITDGLRPDGSILGSGMPRWAMPANDLSDLVSFLFEH